MKKNLINGCAGLLMLGMGFLAQAHTGADVNPGAPGSENHEVEVDADQAISSAEALQKIHANNLAEIEMGRIVIERAESHEIRAYGRILVRERTCHQTPPETGGTALIGQAGPGKYPKGPWSQRIFLWARSLSPEEPAKLDTATDTRMSSFPSLAQEIQARLIDLV